MLNCVLINCVLQDECYEALESISRKINTNDADMRSHVVLSMIKVSAALADVPYLPAFAPKIQISVLLIVFTQITTIFIIAADYDYLTNYTS